MPFAASSASFLGAGQNLRHAARVTRRRHPADRHGDGDRTGGGRHHLVADSGKQAIGGGRHVVRRAFGEHDTELGAGIAAERILAAHPATDALGDRSDDLIGNIEAVGIVDATEIVDRDQQEPAGGAGSHGLFQRLLQDHRQLMPVQLAGKAVVVGEIAEPAVALVALSDDAHGPVCARRPAAGASEPAAAVLDPEFGAGAGIGADAVLRLEEAAAALVALVGLHDGIESGLHIGRVEQLRVAAAG